MKKRTRARGEGTILRHKDGKRWVARVRYTRPGDAVPNRRLLERTCAKKPDAAEALAELRDEAKRREHNPISVEREGQTLGDWLDQWHERRKSQGMIAAKTELSEARNIKRLKDGVQLPKEEGGRAIVGIGGIPLSKVVVHVIDDWFDRLAGVWGQEKLRTRQMIFATLRKALRDAKLPAGNPAQAADRPKAHSEAEKTKPQPFSEEQLDEILAAADQCTDATFGALIWMLATTGARIGEGLGLRWQDVDLDGGKLTIAGAIIEAGGKPRRSVTKTRKPRTIGIPRDLVKRLRELRLKRGERARESALVFGTTLGTPQRLSNLVRRDWHPMLDALEIPRAGFHRLRHSHASMLLAEAQPLPNVSARLGHANAATTLAIYAHMMPGNDVKTTEAVEEFLARRPSSRPS
jgi:integrase